MSKTIDIVHLQIVKEKEIPYGGMRLDAPEKAARIVKGILGETDREQTMICCVDGSMKPTYMQVTGVGTINQCLVSVPEIFKLGMLSNAASLFLFHTHPSGEVDPSSNDIELTRRIRLAGEFLNIPLADHIIIGEGERYFSFRASDYWEECKLSNEEKERIDAFERMHL